MDSIANHPESTMLQKIPTAFFATAASRPESCRWPLAGRLARWLLRCWESQCRHAERPDRFVPRY
jgi:hypothetical protein